MIFLILMGLLTLSCSEEDPSASKAKSERLIPVRVQTLVGADFEDYGEFLGELSGIEQIQLLSHAGGRVRGLTGVEGQQVKKGDRLCDIDGERFRAQYESARLATKVSQQTWERRQLAFKKGTVSKLQVDESHRDYLEAKTREIEAKQNHDGAYCISPISGTIVERLIHPWDMLTKGAPTFVVSKMERMKVVFGIPENQISGYEEGRSVTLTLSVFPGKEWQGELKSLAQSVNSLGRTFLAEAHIGNEDGFLKPGFTVQLKVPRFSLHNQVVVPFNSVLTEGHEQFVYVVQEGIAKRRPVVVLTSDKTRQVIAKGLELGEQIIVSGQLLAGDGARVQILEDEADEKKKQEI